MNFLCKIFGHKLITINKYGYSSRKLYCKRCNQYFGINYSIRAFVPWDDELENFMKEMELT